MVVPLGPLVIALAAMATSLRRSRSRMLALWILGGVPTAIVVAPLVISLLHLEFVELGPTRPAGDPR